MGKIPLDEKRARKRLAQSVRDKVQSMQHRLRCLDRVGQHLSPAEAKEALYSLAKGSNMKQTAEACGLSLNKLRASGIGQAVEGLGEKEVAALLALWNGPWKDHPESAAYARRVNTENKEAV